MRRRREQRRDMCSIIAANKQGELDLVFLENRDRPKEAFIGNSFRRIGNVLGIYDERARGIACGYSLDSSTAGGVANILGYKASKSRGVLLLQALSDGADAEGVTKFIVDRIKTGEYSAATYVVCDPQVILSIESFGKKFHVSRLKRKKFFVATNHLRVLKEGKRISNSILREQYLQKLRRIDEQNVLKFATNHRSPRICRHGRTLASFGVFKEKGALEPKILYSIGEPCKGYTEYKVRE